MANENKPAVAAGSEPAPAEKKKYQIVGLKESKHMPLTYQGVDYNLADLTDEQAEKLIADESFPFVVKK